MSDSAFSFAVIQLGELDQAIADCSQAIELDPSYIRAYQRRAGM